MTILATLVLLTAFGAGSEAVSSSVWTLENDAGRLHGTWTPAEDAVAGALLVHPVPAPVPGF